MCRCVQSAHKNSMSFKTSQQHKNVQETEYARCIFARIRLGIKLRIDLFTIILQRHTNEKENFQIPGKKNVQMKYQNTPHQHLKKQM